MSSGIWRPRGDYGLVWAPGVRAWLLNERCIVEGNHCYNAAWRAAPCVVACRRVLRYASPLEQMGGDSGPRGGCPAYRSWYSGMTPYRTIA